MLHCPCDLEVAATVQDCGRGQCPAEEKARSSCVFFLSEETFCSTLALSSLCLALGDMALQPEMLRAWWSRHV